MSSGVVVVNIENATVRNEHYRQVLGTTGEAQLVVMSLRPGEEIGRERHAHTTQFIRIEAGSGVARIGDDDSTTTTEYALRAGDAVLIPANTWHNIIASGDGGLKLYTLYAPPEHAPGTLQPLKPTNTEKAAPRTRWWSSWW
jgi:mannose-6-phosphate isomerase-like protein (cupin superfamily)